MERKLTGYKAALNCLTLVGVDGKGREGDDWLPGYQNISLFWVFFFMLPNTIIWEGKRHCPGFQRRFFRRKTAFRPSKSVTNGLLCFVKMFVFFF